MEGFNIPLEFGGAFLIGMAIGYFFKKAIKIALFFAGMILLLLISLEHSGIITINQNALENMANSGAETIKSSYDFLKSWILNLKTAAAGVGFMAGLKIG